MSELNDVEVATSRSSCRRAGLQPWFSQAIARTRLRQTVRHRAVHKSSTEKGVDRCAMT